MTKRAKRHSSTCVTLTIQRNLDAKNDKDYAAQLEALVAKLEGDGFSVDVTSEDDITDPPHDEEDE